MILGLLFCALLFPTFSFADSVTESPHQVWKTSGRSWTVEREEQFARWVEGNITENFFIHHKIPVDCADVPYAIRWIYARIAHLPAAATTRDHKLIGHWSTTWRHLPTHPEWFKDRRFRAALLHMLSETTTRTLPSDTYPIRIGPDSVLPGTVFFITESHAGVIGRVSLDGSQAHPLQTWESTVPAKIQKLSEKNFLSPRPESTIYSGLVKFRWPILRDRRWQYLPVQEHPFYSLEQYASSFYEGYGNYVEAVANRIDPANHDPWERAMKVIETITRFLQTRVPIVLEGYRRCHKGGCPEGSPLWEIYSTPGRDGFIILLMDHLANLIASNHLDEEALRAIMLNIEFQISRARSVTFYDLFQNYLWLSSQPGDSIEARWGLKKCEMILSQVRASQKSIAFIEQTYRESDPKYADFTIRQQHEILRRLQVEWERSECKKPPAARLSEDLK
jgi:hypothetical protein